jgi:hypothetical protein
MVELIGALLLLTAVKVGVFPEPDAAKPIEGLELIQLNRTALGLPEKLFEGKTAPSITVVSEIELSEPIGFTVTSSVAVSVAHWPGAVVNVYVPEIWLLTTDGVHVPFIPLAEVVGNSGAVLPAHKFSVVPKLNVGVKIGFTVTVYVKAVIH